jgi:hypothetical protein
MLDSVVAMAVSRAIVALCMLCSATLHAAELPEESALRAMRELRWPEARATLEAALKAGDLPRERLLALQAAYAETLAVLEGGEAAEREFRRLLVLDPQRSPPARRSPVVSLPFERARRWVAQNGSLKASAAAVSPAEIDVRVSGDPLAMVAGARVWLRSGTEGAFQKVPGSSLHATLPPAGDEARFYYIEVVDAADDVLMRIGSADEPLALPLPARTAAPKLAAPAPAPAAVVMTTPAPPRSRKLLYGGIAVAVTGVAIIAAAIALDLVAVSEFRTQERRCMTVNCTPNDFATFNAERNSAYALYAVSGAAMTSGLIMIIVDRVRAARQRSR